MHKKFDKICQPTLVRTQKSKIEKITMILGLSKKHDYFIQIFSKQNFFLSISIVFYFE